MNALNIVALLLDEQAEVEIPVAEASVHRPTRGKVWIAAFTGATPGQQVWRSTGLTDRVQALALARRWEAEAQQQRTAFGHLFKKPTVRVRQGRQRGPGEQLTQKEVAALLGMSERGVREVERRAFEKLRKHPLLQQLWQQHLTGDLDEDALQLTPAEIAALFALAQTPTEQNLVQKVLGLLQG
jgi:hypothetical protein